MNKIPMPIISVIIATYNRNHLLEGLLDALAKQTLPPDQFEIIIVDDNSTDATQEKIGILRAQASINVRYIRQERNGGPARARNEGIRRAVGSIVAITDDDCLPEPQWLEQLLASFTDASVVGAEGPIISNAERISALTHQVTNDVPGALFTANIAYRKDVLFDIGLFDERFPYPQDEDLDLGLRACEHGRIVFNRDAVVFHPPIQINVFAHARRVRYCLSNIRFFLKHPARLRKRRYGVLWMDTMQDVMVGICKNQLHLSYLLLQDPTRYGGYSLYNVLRLFHTITLISKYREEESSQRRLLTSSGKTEP